MTDLLKGFLFQKVFKDFDIYVVQYYYKEVYVSLKNDQYF